MATGKPLPVEKKLEEGKEDKSVQIPLKSNVRILTQTEMHEPYSQVKNMIIRFFRKLLRMDAYVYAPFS